MHVAVIAAISSRSSNHCLLRPGNLLRVGSAWLTHRPSIGSAAHAVFEAKRQAAELQPAQPSHEPEYVCEPIASLARPPRHKS